MSMKTMNCTNGRWTLRTLNDYKLLKNTKWQWRATKDAENFFPYLSFPKFFTIFTKVGSFRKHSHNRRCRIRKKTHVLRDVPLLSAAIGDRLCRGKETKVKQANFAGRSIKTCQNSARALALIKGEGLVFFFATYHCTESRSKLFRWLNWKVPSAAADSPPHR